MQIQIKTNSVFMEQQYTFHWILNSRYSNRYYTPHLHESSSILSLSLTPYARSLTDTHTHVRNTQRNLLGEKHKVFFSLFFSNSIFFRGFRRFEMRKLRTKFKQMRKCPWWGMWINKLKNVFLLRERQQRQRRTSLNGESHSPHSICVLTSYHWRVFLQLFNSSLSSCDFFFCFYYYFCCFCFTPAIPSCRSVSV